MKSNTKSVLLLLCLLMHRTHANDDDVGNANDYVDEILQNLRNEPSMVSKLDPIKVPEISEKNFQATDGVIHGLASLYRHGDCTLSYDGTTVTVTGEVAVKDVTIDIKYRAKALFFWIKGHVNGKVDDVAVKLVLSAVDGKAKLDSFKVVHLGDYKIKKITGMSVVLNWMLKLIANSIAKKSRGKIIEALEGGVATAVGEILAKVDLPIGQ